MGWLSQRNEVLLTASFEGREVATIRRKQVPVEVTPTVEIVTASPTLTLRDSSQTEWVYDLSSVLGDGARFLFISIRVGPTFGSQGDCLLANSRDLPAEAFANGQALGIRFQPIYLPECPSDPKELIGRGLFFRGFHFSGVITPGNVSHLAICDSCRKSFRFQSFHAGFSNLVYFYCESGIHTLVVSSYTDGAPQLLVENPAESIARFEEQLPACDRCRTRFRFYNPFRCPHCAAPYIDFQRFPAERASEYYGNHLYGSELQEFSPA